MKQLPESLGALGVEGRVDGMRPGGAPAQRRLKTTLVEEMDGVAGALGVAAEAAGDLVGVLAPGAGEKYLAPAEDESIRRAQACLQGLALGVRDRTHEDWSSDVVEDNSSTTASSEYALDRGRAQRLLVGEAPQKGPEAGTQPTFLHNLAILRVDEAEG
jgi:hypothetical protein